jgi:ComF family protein
LGLGAWAKASTNSLLSTLFEPPCAGCRKPLTHPLNGAVCEDCWADLRLAPPLLDRLRVDQGVDWSCAVDRYEGRMKEIIQALKYERRRSIAAPLGELMRGTGARVLQGADLVVPVPLHPRREYQRGFNQADDLARHLGLPVVPLLKRVVHTQSQIELPKHQRQQNVKDAFALNPVPRSRFPVPDVIVLVDDVSTTGSTLDACARVLKGAGVKEVRAITAARVVTERR